MDCLSAVDQIDRRIGVLEGAGLHAAMVSDDGSPTVLFKASRVLLRQTPVWEDIEWIRNRWDGALAIKASSRRRTPVWRWLTALMR